MIRTMNDDQGRPDPGLRIDGRVVGNYVQVGSVVAQPGDDGWYIVATKGPDIATGALSVVGVVLDRGELLDLSDHLRHLASLPC